LTFIAFLTMDVVDFDVREAERDASPDAFPNVPKYRPEPATPFSLNKETEKAVEEELHPVELGRIKLHRCQHKSTVGETPRSLNRLLSEPLIGLGAKKPFPPALPDREEYVVEFLGHDDPMHPHNWPTRKKYA
jgi:DHA1 family multidrug resistance protein-like MFS transporter